MGFVNLDCPGCGQPMSLDESREFGFCAYCGKKVMLDKVIVEHKGAIKVDQSQELDNLYILSRRARENDDHYSAQKYYELIITKDPNSWEAYFYSNYYYAKNCEGDEIIEAVNRLNNSTPSVLSLIEQSFSDEPEYTKAVDIRMAVSEVATQLISLSFELSDLEINDYNNKEEYLNVTLYRCHSLYKLLYDFGEDLLQVLGNDYRDISVQCWESAISLHIRVLPYFAKITSNKNFIMKYEKKIQAYDPSYRAPYKTYELMLKRLFKKHIF